MTRHHYRVTLSDGRRESTTMHMAPSLKHAIVMAEFSRGSYRCHVVAAAVELDGTWQPIVREEASK